MLSAAQLRNAGYVEEVTAQGSGGDFQAVTTVYTVHRINDATKQSPEMMNDLELGIRKIVDFCRSINDVASIKMGISDGRVYFSSLLGNVEAIESVFVKGFELFLYLLKHCTKEEMICSTVQSDVEYLKSVMERFGVPPKFVIKPHILNMTRTELRERETYFRDHVSRKMKHQTDCEKESVYLIDVWKIRDEILRDDDKFRQMEESLSTMMRTMVKAKLAPLYFIEGCIDRESGTIYYHTLFENVQGMPEVNDFVMNSETGIRLVLEFMVLTDFTFFSGPQNEDFCHLFGSQREQTNETFVASMVGEIEYEKQRNQPESSSSEKKEEQEEQEEKKDEEKEEDSDEDDGGEDGDIKSSVTSSTKSVESLPSINARPKTEKVDFSSMTTIYRVYTINDDVLRSDYKMAELKAVMNNMVDFGNLYPDCGYIKMGILKDRVYFSALFGNYNSLDYGLVDSFELFVSFLCYVKEEEMVCTTSEENVEHVKSIFVKYGVFSKFEIVPSLPCGKQLGVQTLWEPTWTKLIRNDYKEGPVDIRNDLNLLCGSWKIRPDILNDEGRYQNMVDDMTKLKRNIWCTEFDGLYFFDASINKERGEIYYQELFRGKSEIHEYFKTAEVGSIMNKHVESYEVYIFAADGQQNKRLCDDLMEEKQIVKAASKHGVLVAASGTRQY